MAAEEFNLPIVAQEHSPLHDFDADDDDDAAEETLSLSDLRLNSSASDCEYEDDSSKDDRSSSSVDEDLFEFFSQDFMASGYAQRPAGSIIFCGKLIPCKGAAAAVADDGHHHDEEEENKEFTSKQKNTKKRQILSLQSQSFEESRTRNSLSQQQQRKSYKTSKSLPVQSSGSTKKAMVDKYDQLLTRSKVSILAAPMKPRWYLHGRFPMEMELNDMKLRQCKRAQMKTFHQSHDKNRVHKMVDSSSGGGGSRQKPESSWSLLRVLGCKGNEGADAMVKSSLACLPQPQA